MRVGSDRLHRGRTVGCTRWGVGTRRRGDGKYVAFRTHYDAEDASEVAAPGKQIGDLLSGLEVREGNALIRLTVHVARAVRIGTGRVRYRGSNGFRYSTGSLCRGDGES